MISKIVSPFKQEERLFDLNPARPFILVKTKLRLAELQHERIGHSGKCKRDWECCIQSGRLQGFLNIFLRCKLSIEYLESLLQRAITFYSRAIELAQDDDDQKKIFYRFAVFDQFRICTIVTWRFIFFFAYQ